MGVAVLAGVGLLGAAVAALAQREEKEAEKKGDERKAIANC